MNPENNPSPQVFEDTTALPDVPAGMDRRSFLMRSAVISSAAFITGRTLTPEAHASAASAPPSKPQFPLSPSLNVVKESK